ncbi:MAG: hypothetical protein IT324_11595 [Anaerolineae bacterium]|nr:hypothetical protein [Anaerolineae bacterium]
MFNLPPIPAFSACKRGATITLMLLTLTVLTACAPSAAAPTNAPTSTPTDSPTPTPGVGVAVKSPKWEVIITGVREINRLSTYPNTYTPKEGYTFLVVDTKIRSLIMPKRATAAPTGAATTPPTRTAVATAAATGAATAQATQMITTNAAAILAEDGTIYKANGSVSSGMGCVSCISWSYVSDDSPKQMGFVFVLSKKIVHQTFRFQFQDVPLIPFALPEAVATATSEATASAKP